MNKKKFSTYYYALCILLFIISFYATLTISADTYSFDWDHVNNGVVLMDSSDDYLTGNWGSAYNSGRSLWNSSSAPILILDTSFSYSNVDLFSIDETTWLNNGWGNVIAWSQLFDGNMVCNEHDENPDERCNSADYGAIYFNNGMYPGNLTTAAGTIAHEFGHIAGLAHPTANVYSIMHQLWHPYRVQFITQYDITELQNKY